MIVKVKKRSGQWETSNLFQKNSEISAFFDKNCPKKIGKKHHCRPVNWMVFYWLVQKHSHLQAYCKDRSQKYNLCPLKNLKIEIFSANSPKKISAAKLWNIIDREPIVMFIQKSDKSDQ